MACIVVSATCAGRVEGEGEQFVLHLSSPDHDLHGWASGVVDGDQTELSIFGIEEAVAEGERLALFAVRAIQRGCLKDRESARARRPAIVRTVVEREHVRVGAQHEDVADVVLLDERTEFGALGRVAEPTIGVNRVLLRVAQPRD